MAKRYIEIAKSIRDRIESGVYKPGEPLASRPELAKEFGVARATVDRCIEFLVSNGTLLSRQGSGTYVNADAARDARKIAFVCGSGSMGQLRSDAFAKLFFLSYEQLKNQSSRAELVKYDGILWYRPEERAIEWAASLKSKLPQVLINRTVEDFHCVSTDHKGAYKEITLERLKLLPETYPFLLRHASDGLVSSYREKGFVEACREAGRFYEVISMPDEFDAKMSVLKEHLDARKLRPLLVVSASLSHSGAFILWTRELGLKWKKDVYYSDFDNNYDRSVWGVKVSSYIQNDQEVLSSSIRKIVNLVSGKNAGDKHILIFPRRINGET